MLGLKTTQGKSSIVYRKLFISDKNRMIFFKCVGPPQLFVKGKFNENIFGSDRFDKSIPNETYEEKN